MSRAPWRIAMASSVGTSHFASGEPCQDSHCHLQATDPSGRQATVLVASDGAGTASGAEIGAAQACQTFARLVVDYVEAGGDVRRIGRQLVRRWIGGVAHGLALRAGNLGRDRHDFRCTLLAAIMGENAAAFVQLGDGAIVTSQPVEGGWRYIFWPQHGEFANTTNFLTAADAGESFDFALTTDPVEEIAIFTDGLENLVLQKTLRVVHAPFFDGMFGAVRRSKASGVDAKLSADLAEYLSSSPIDQRTDDDKTLILASRRR